MAPAWTGRQHGGPGQAAGDEDRAGAGPPGLQQLAHLLLLDVVRDDDHHVRGVVASGEHLELLPEPELARDPGARDRVGGEHRHGGPATGHRAGGSAVAVAVDVPDGLDIAGSSHGADRVRQSRAQRAVLIREGTRRPVAGAPCAVKPARTASASGRSEEQSADAPWTASGSVAPRSNRSCTSVISGTASTSETWSAAGQQAAVPDPTGR